MSLLFSPIKILIVKAFVCNLQLTNQQTSNTAQRGRVQLSPTRLKVTLSPWHATTIYETAQDRACQETQSKTGFCFETAADLHLSAPLLPSPVYHKKLCSREVCRAVEPALHSQGCTYSTNPHPAPRGWQQAAVSQDAPLNAKRANKFPPSLPQHTHTEAAGQAAKP